MKFKFFDHTESSVLSGTPIELGWEFLHIQGVNGEQLQRLRDWTGRSAEQQKDPDG